MKTILVTCLIADALSTLRPGAQWVLHGTDYSGLQWLDKSSSQPTQKEVDQAISDCQTNEISKKSQKDQALSDAKDTTKDAQTRLDALIKAIDLK